MSEKEDIQRQFEHSIKGVAANMVSEYIDLGYSVHDYTTEMQNLVKNRDKALKGLHVSVSREHLQVLTDWFVKALIGYDRTDISTEEILGRNPRCFGTRTSSKTCGTSDLRIKGLCKACIAISPLLQDDC